MAVKLPLNFMKKIVDAVTEKLNLPEHAIIQELEVKLSKDDLPIVRLEVKIKGE